MKKGYDIPVLFIPFCRKEIAQKGKPLYSENCRKRAVEMYGKENRFQEYVELYENICQEASILHIP
jgi:hypothetical protein